MPHPTQTILISPYLSFRSGSRSCPLNTASHQENASRAAQVRQRSGSKLDHGQEPLDECSPGMDRTGTPARGYQESDANTAPQGGSAEKPHPVSDIASAGLLGLPGSVAAGFS